jgi:hypothetical protein
MALNDINNHAETVEKFISAHFCHEIRQQGKTL